MAFFPKQKPCVPCGELTLCLRCSAKRDCASTRHPYSSLPLSRAFATLVIAIIEETRNHDL